MRRRKQGMGTGKLKGLRRFTQDGVRYVYHRATGIRMPDLPENDNRFLKAYLEAEQQIETAPAPRKRSAAPKAGTLSYGWRKFILSDDFKDLSEGYRVRLQAHADEILATGGRVPMRGIRSEHIEKDLADMPPGTTRNSKRMRMKTWRALFAYLKNEKMIEKNYALLAELPRAGKSDKHKLWTKEHVARFRQHWPLHTTQRVTLELLLFFGCRLSDAVRLGPGMVDRDGWLRFTQKKTKGEVEIPFDRPLPSFADREAHDLFRRALALRQGKHMTWIVTAYGAARSEKAASSWFSEACRAAGLKGIDRRTAHGLRVTCLSRMAERDATPHQIGAWGGHESLKEIEAYTKSANKRRILSANEPNTQIVQVVKS
ncbi:tyrosine-type recombinase/integrase [Roseobacter sp. MH60115]|uniref:tyrosine-type recombinase/integrase n=1 Tax=Roseobacter sp. MH60115 TaxID=2785324 RepID=UPI0018A27563|nr:site-specific integrase [Roseobacter sp. MH60115]